MSTYQYHTIDVVLYVQDIKKTKGILETKEGQDIQSKVKPCQSHPKTHTHTHTHNQSINQSANQSEASDPLIFHIPQISTLLDFQQKNLRHFW